MIDRYRLAPALLILCGAASAQAQLRVAFLNVATLSGNQAAIEQVLAAIHDDDKPGFATPADVLVFTEVRQSNIAALTALVTSSSPQGVSYSLGTFTTSSSEDQATGANAIFLRNGRVFEIPAGHEDMFTGAGRNTDRWLVQLLGYSSSQAQFLVYGSHLKASTGQANVDLRLFGVQVIRTDADGYPSGTPILYSGDFNFYTSTESGYQAFLADPGSGKAVDPLPGQWTGAGNAVKHTQSPRDIARSLVGGGMDDRFDMILCSATVADGAGLAVIPGTTRALGNDGLHYNLAINNGNNFYYPGQLSRSNTLANALFDASDHVPVIVDLQQPAVMEAWIAAQPGRVIRYAPVLVEMRAWNSVETVTPLGVDPLQFNAVATGGVSGSASGTAPIDPDFTSRFFTLNTNTVGPVSGTVTVTSSNEAVQNPLLPLGVVGQVVRPSNASFSGAENVDATTAMFSVPSGPGVVELPVPIFNLGFDASQALLDVDGVQLASGSSAIGVTQGSAFGIGAVPGTLTFSIDTTGLAPGSYARSATLLVSDENIPGESMTTLSLTLQVQIGSSILGDLNGDGIVNGADLGMLLAQWGGAGGSADLDGNGIVNGADLGLLLGNWS